MLSINSDALQLAKINKADISHFLPKRFSLIISLNFLKIGKALEYFFLKARIKLGLV